MESRLVLVLAMVVLAAGCADSSSQGKKAKSGKGLVVEEFSVADQSLAPGQRTPVSVTLSNHHTDEIEIQDVSLYNLGFLELENPDRGLSDRCNPDSIEPARKDFAPKMECSWIIRAPSESELGDFRSKSVSMKLNLEYSSTVSNNQDPLKVEFRPLNQIDSRETLEKTFSNGEVQMKLSTENPAPKNGALLELKVKDANSGDSRRVASGYNFSYTPEEVFPEENCPRQEKPVTGSKVSITCEISSTAEGTRNLFISTSYKYVKSPSLDVEVIKP